ncbi:hypothetical protein F4804DRAFT_327755 [Jackrogersella minutella]|nr:hypothetical protein F4804DRAFT_327755 [Jackrogersella minutella]
MNEIIAVVNKMNMKIPSMPLIHCTDSFSLYEATVKLGTTAESRLMIDIMTLRESYEKKEITEVRWIHGADNPTDAMTKSSSNTALRSLIDDNEIVVRIEGSVSRKE